MAPSHGVSQGLTCRFPSVWPGCFRIPSSERLSDKCKLGGGVPTTPAWVVLLAEEESQLQVTRYLIMLSDHYCPQFIWKVAKSVIMICWIGFKHFSESFVCMASRKSYLVMICPNQQVKLESVQPLLIMIHLASAESYFSYMLRSGLFRIWRFYAQRIYSGFKVI